MSQRRRDIDLYQLLSRTLAICERVEQRDVEQLKREIVERDSATKSRSYVEKETDVYLVVGRAVFEPETNRAACWRYSACMRRAAELQLKSTDLTEWLRKNGGLNALFRTRGNLARMAKTKTLHLNQQIEVSKDGPFTLVLKMDSRGFYDVLSQHTD